MTKHLNANMFLLHVGFSGLWKDVLKYLLDVVNLYIIHRKVLFTMDIIRIYYVVTINYIRYCFC